MVSGLIVNIFVILKFALNNHLVIIAN